MIWGLVIQGPVLSFGQGPNNSKYGFSASETIEANINNFIPHVSRIVVSTWKDSGLDFRDRFSDKVVLIESNVPIWRDHDNRIKQFVSLYEGVKSLTSDSSVTHILKIRSDQLVDPGIVQWLNSFFLSATEWFDPGSALQESFLVFSEIRNDSPFYAGDYIFAGTSGDMSSFCRANLAYGARKLHPSIGLDYILKQLSIIDESFWDHFVRRIPLLWQVSNLSNRCVQSYWLDILQTRFSVMPKSIFCKIVWRGKLMTDILPPEVMKGFAFFDDWKAIRTSSKVKPESKSLRFIIPTREVLNAAKYEYRRYWKGLLRFYAKRFGILR